MKTPNTRKGIMMETEQNVDTQINALSFGSNEDDEEKNGRNSR